MTTVLKTIGTAALLALMTASPARRPATQGGAPAGTTAYAAVSYVEVMASSRSAAIAALKQYREPSREDDGYLRVEFFEQVGRPGQFTVVETRQSQKAFDAHVAAAHTKQYPDELQPMTGGPLDERVYEAIE